jgi:hypothetical protein
MNIESSSGGQVPKCGIALGLHSYFSDESALSLFL